MVFFVWGGQLRRAPENGFSNRLSDPVGQCARRPVAERCNARKRYLIVRIAISDPTLPPRRTRYRRFPCSTGSQRPAPSVPQGARRRVLRVPATAGAKRLACNCPKLDRPGVPFFGRIHLGIDPDVGRRETEHIRNDLRKHGAMPLPLWHRGDMHGNASHWIDRDRRSGLSAVLRAGLAALGRCHHRRDVTHIGHTWLDHGGIADAVEAPLGARCISSRLELCEPAFVDGALDRLLIVSRVEQRPTDRPVGKTISGDRVTPDDIRGSRPSSTAMHAGPAAPAQK